MNKIQSISKAARGQSLTLVGLSLFGMIAIAGLAVDGAQVFQGRRSMQNASDSAATAGARELALGSGYTFIAKKINEYVSFGGGVGNGASSYTAWYEPSGLTVTQPPAKSDNCIKVTAALTTSTRFIGMVGFNTVSTNATSQACSLVVTGTTALMWPMAFYTQTLNYGESVNLFGNCSAAAGNFCWLSLDGNNGTPQLQDKLQNLYAGPYEVYGSAFDCTGSKTSIASLTIPNCIKGFPGVGAAEQDAAASQIWHDVMVLVFDNLVNNGSNTYYHVIGFARFTVTEVCLKNCGSNKRITGIFKRYVFPGRHCLSQCPPDFGVRVIATTQ
ncbi:MAG: Tad domain-containing protein [Chloroflexi bacterium]|nr:Tad domain-containing protein [Chloroflexota bacterium]